MKKKKGVEPERIEGKLRIAGEKFEIGSIKSVSESSPSDLEKAVRRLSKRKIFSPPVYALYE